MLLFALGSLKEGALKLSISANSKNSSTLITLIRTIEENRIRFGAPAWKNSTLVQRNDAIPSNRSKTGRDTH